ncbi:hypothetical protein NDU88_004476 [Pleurodeles waltl]|uniref:Uncharacterized protein n=1 Tax=Pleurodeles waltl TaxID=8319 RepID=A0AAV7PHL4_PLEWA|nr:hypothetical protein NDU88_004476 [Pleurodeles waltl]
MGLEPKRISIGVPADKTSRDWDCGPALRTKGTVLRQSAARDSGNQKRCRRGEAEHVARDGPDRTVAELGAAARGKKRSGHTAIPGKRFPQADRSYERWGGLIPRWVLPFAWQPAGPENSGSVGIGARRCPRPRMS